MRAVYQIVAAALAGVLLLASGCALTSGEQEGRRFSDRELRRASQLADEEGTYFDKVYGAWSGKLIGLILGQPTEGWGKEHIEKKAREVGCYPITAYMPANFDTPHKGFLVGSFDSSPPNDDSDLMLVALLAVRKLKISKLSTETAAYGRQIISSCRGG